MYTHQVTVEVLEGKGYNDHVKQFEGQRMQFSKHKSEKAAHNYIKTHRPNFSDALVNWKVEEIA